MGIDLATMAATISKLKANGQIGYGESKTITYDGTGEKMDILGNGETYAKASSEFVNGNNISKIVRAVAGNDGEIVGENVYTKDELNIEVTDIATMVSYNDTLLLISAAADIEGYLEKGTYVFDLVTGVEGDMAHTWISSIEYGELHTIDPKYLPPDVLPRVELSEETATTLLGAGVATLNAAEAATLDNMASNATPFLICAKMQGMTLVNGLMQYVLTNDTFSPMYVGILPYNYRNGSSISLEVYNIRKDGDSWTVDTKRVVVTP